MESQENTHPRSSKEKDLKRKQALEAAVEAKRRGISRINQYAQQKNESAIQIEDGEDSASDLDDFIERDPNVDKYYREVDDDEYEFEDTKNYKRTKKTSQAGNDTYSLLRFQNLGPAPKKTETTKPVKKEVKEVVLEKVDLDNVWEQMDQVDGAIANQFDASYLMKSEEEKKLLEYDMIVVRPKASQQKEEASASKKRQRDIVEEINKSTPSKNICYEQTANGYEPITEIVKGRQPDETPMKKLGTIHKEVNEDSTSFKNFLDTEFKKAQKIDDDDERPKDVLVQDEEKTDSMLIEEMLAQDRLKKQEEEKNLKNSWQDIQNNSEVIQEETPTVANKFELQLPLEGEKGDLYFYYIDAWEDQREHPGLVFLFGKVRNPKNPALFESCCVVVRKVSRVCYVVPSQYKRTEAFQGPETENIEVDFLSIMQEFKGKLTQMHQQKIKFKVVERNYSFELPILHGKRKYLKVKYDGNLPPINGDLKGKTFSHVIGTSWSLLENLIIKKNIKGPQWLRISGVEKPAPAYRKSWCVFECCADYENIHKLENETRPHPPVKVMSLALKTVRINNNWEIANISAIKFSKVDTDKNVEISNKDLGMSFFSILRKIPGMNIPRDFNQKASKSKYKIRVEESEAALINNFIAQVCEFDPDIIAGHDAYTSIFDTLLNRIRKLRTPNWGKLSRLRKSNHPDGASIFRVRYATCGRLICDTFLSAREFVRETDYNLTHLSKSLLNERRDDFDVNSTQLFYRDSDLLLKMIDHTTQDAFLTSAIMFKLQIIPLTKHLTMIAGNSWARSLQNARAERNEMLLIHEFRQRKFIYPDKFQIKNEDKLLFENDEIKEKDNKKKDKKKYAGGLVLEPKTGLYNDIILLLDFNSLYPSIIQEYNICFTTIERPPANNTGKKQQEGEEEQNTNEDVDFTQLKKRENEDSILPKVIKNLVQQRREVKKQMKYEKNEAKLQSLDIKQKAVKLVANSMYGCLGFSSSRFYAKPIAATITRFGRQILEESVIKVQDKMNKQVIYGDTDSIMINTQLQKIPEAIELGNRLKKEINEKYKCLEIDIDGIFMPLLLVKKKKYAAMKLENLADFMVPGNKNIEPKFKQEVKGLDMVRRDWCPLSKNASYVVLREILSGKSIDEMVEGIKMEMTKLGKRVRGEDGTACTLREFTITKQLTKDPNKYPNDKGQPHVQVAKKLLEKGVQGSSLINHYIPYVIIKNDKEGLGEKACHPEEFAQKRGELEIDVEYYLSQQVMPPIQRMLQIIPGILISEVAICLGLDGSKFRNITRSYQHNEYEDEEQLESYYNSILNPQHAKDKAKIQFMVKCKNCGKENKFTGTSSQGNEFSPFLCEDPLCRGHLNLAQLYNLIKLRVREEIESYYAHQMKDSEGKILKSFLINGPKFEEKKSKDVLIWLRALKASFTLKQNQAQLYAREHKEFCEKVTKYVDGLLMKSKFEVVNLDMIFNKMRELHIF